MKRRNNSICSTLRRTICQNQAIDLSWVYGSALVQMVQNQVKSRPNRKYRFEPTLIEPIFKVCPEDFIFWIF